MHYLEENTVKIGGVPWEKRLELHKEAVMVRCPGDDIIKRRASLCGSFVLFSYLPLLALFILGRLVSVRVLRPLRDDQNGLFGSVK